MHDIDPETHDRRWLTLGVLCLSLTIVMVSNMSLNVALPSLARDLDASTSELQWIVDAYALVFAGLLFTAGAIGDRFGRKGALQGGLVTFLVAATVAVLADSATGLIAARAVMGVGAAFVMPSTLSIITNIFGPDERPKAIALWAGVAAGGAAAGPSISGLLLEHFWWGSVFLINVPLVVLALVAGRVLVPTSRNPAEPPLDVAGAGLSILGIGALVYGIIEGPEHGWLSPPSFAAFALAAVGLLAFGWWELRTEQPMLDLRLFRDRRFTVGSTGIGLMFFALFGNFFLVAPYVQLVLGYPPLKAGLVYLPMSIAMVLFAPRAPALVTRFGLRAVVVGGLLLPAVALLLLSRSPAQGSVWIILATLPLLSAGASFVGSPLTAQVMSAVPLGQAGVGSAMNDTSRELGGALGVAVLGSILTTRFGSALAPALTGLPEVDRIAAESGLAGALEVARRTPGDAGGTLADAARSAYVDGLSASAIAAAGVLCVAAFVASRLLPRRAPAPVGAAAVAPTGDEPAATPTRRRPSRVAR